VLSDINDEVLQEAAQSLRDNGFEAMGVKADVTSEKDLENLVAETKNTYGRIDIVINNAGLQHVSPIEEFPTEKYELMIKIMLTAPFILTKNLLPKKEEQGIRPNNKN
jgi:3-hydroxybutyrate dehydrogenase